MAISTLRPDSDLANPSAEQRQRDFILCGSQPFYAAGGSREHVETELRQLYALTAALSAGFDGGDVRQLNDEILSGVMDALNASVARAAFHAEELGGAPVASARPDRIQ
jgi:hypothetical protein